MSTTLTRRTLVHVLTACLAGSVLEWYDFTLFAWLVPILSGLFFPHESSASAQLAGYSVFAIGFIARPLGAILAGHFGDKISRKKILLFCMAGMGLSSLLIALLPTYAHIGIAAPILLIFLRILQGLIIGGEVPGAGAYAIETFSRARRGLFSSFPCAGSGLGLISASTLCALATYALSPAQMASFGWRILFLIGSLVAVPAFLLRHNLQEPTHFINARSQVARLPLWRVFRNYTPQLLTATALYMAGAVLTYLGLVFMPAYVHEMTGLAKTTALTINTLALAFSTVLVPLCGGLSDRLGRKPLLVYTLAILTIASLPAFWLVLHAGVLGLVIAQFLFGAAAGSLYGAITASLLEMFPTAVRYSGAALAYNVGFALFGGTAPLIAQRLISSLHTNIAPGIYLTLISAIAWFAAYRMTETAHQPLL